MKTRFALLIVAMLMAVSAAASPALAGPSAPTHPSLSPDFEVVGGGQVSVNISSSPQTLTYIVYRGTRQTQQAGDSVTSTEYICGIEIRGQFGNYLGKLEQHVFADFYSSTNIGWRLYSNSYTTTDAPGWCCRWDRVTNPPYATNGYGQITNKNEARVNGDHLYFAGRTSWHTIEYFTTLYDPIRGSWSCSGGPGRLSPPG